MDLILTLPATNYEDERGLSQIKLIKTNIRSTIKMLAASIDEFDPIPTI